MTGGIQPYSGEASPSDITSAGSAGPAAQAAAKAPGQAAVAESAPTNDSVTLTQNAQTSARLLASAQAADGFDGQAVAGLAAAIQSGSFDISPDQLAASIITAFAQITP